MKTFRSIYFRAAAYFSRRVSLNPQTRHKMAFVDSIKTAPMRITHMKPVKGIITSFNSHPESAKRTNPPVTPPINANASVPNQTTREQKTRSKDVARAL
jgi:hypothetical protein